MKRSKVIYTIEIYGTQVVQFRLRYFLVWKNRVSGARYGSVKDGFTCIVSYYMHVKSM